MTKTDTVIQPKTEAGKFIIQAPNRHNPIYILGIESEENPDKTDFFAGTKLDRFTERIVFRGVQLTKTQKTKLEKNANEEIVATGTIVEIEIPWQRIKRIRNLTYKPSK